MGAVLIAGALFVKTHNAILAAKVAN